MNTNSIFVSMLAFAIMAVFAQARVGDPMVKPNGHLSNGRISADITAARELKDCPATVALWDEHKCCCGVDFEILFYVCKNCGVRSLEEEYEEETEEETRDLIDLIDGTEEEGISTVLTGDDQGKIREENVNSAVRGLAVGDWEGCPDSLSGNAVCQEWGEYCCNKCPKPDSYYWVPFVGYKCWLS